MKLNQLKEETYRAWNVFCAVEGTPIVDSLFREEVKKFGDRRKKSTWEAVAVHFEARWVMYGLDPSEVVRYFSDPDSSFSTEFRFQVFDVLVSYEEGVVRLKMGLEQIFQEESKAQWEQDLQALRPFLSNNMQLVEAN
ncbi:hypothetical protein ACQ4M4_28250 [Leptolyngbya sp. AN02str]|uniref:hypothetical protein n=1 Tax=Leptolyngbya sp. AN02str TaxID=3423363 RepID=UPI003D31FE2B